MAIGWFISSGVALNLLFLLVGAGITFFVQSRTQKRAWKREYSIKIVEIVYSGLFGSVKKIALSLEEKRYLWLDFGIWREMQDDHRYFMVDKKFRANLDLFRTRLEAYSKIVIKLRGDVIPKIVLDKAESVLRIVADDVPTISVKYSKGRLPILSSPRFIDCLLSETHPAKYVIGNDSDASIIEVLYTFMAVSEGARVKGTHTYDGSSKTLNTFWKSCLSVMREDESYGLLVRENERLLEEAKNLKQEIAKRIEEPWRI